MLDKTIEERRIARELTSAKRKAAAEARRVARDERFESDKQEFAQTLLAWENDPSQSSKLKTLRALRHALHRRIIWSADAPLNWTCDDDGAYTIQTWYIDALQKPMALLLQFVKAEHKIAHDRAVLALRAEHFAARRATPQAGKKEEKCSKSDERPHTPELSA